MDKVKIVVAHALRHRPVRFLLSGGGITLIHIAIQTLLIEVAHISASIAFWIAFHVAAGFGYLAHSKVTFNSPASLSSAWKFYLQTLSIQAANFFIFYLLANIVMVHHLPSIIISTLIVQLLNYSLLKKLVFKV